MLNSHDLASVVYLPHKDKLAFRAIPRQLRYLLRWYEHIDPAKAAAIRPHIDVQESWMPMDLGEGVATIRTWCGALNIHLSGGSILMEVKPLNPMTKELMGAEPVFLTGERELLLCAAEGMAYATRILRQAGRLYADYGVIPEIEAWWHQRLDLVPSAEWVAAREAALKGRHEPPRACHWMSELK